MSYTYLRLYIVNGGGNPAGGSGSSCCFSELKFFDGSGTQIPTTGGTASASTAGFGAAANAFDGNINTIWGANVGTSVASPQWLQYHFPSGVSPASYSLTARNDGFFGQAPTAWQFQGSNDGSTWDNLGNYSPPARWSSAAQVQSFTVDPAHGNGAIWQLYVTGISGTNTCSIAEWTLFDSSGAPISTTAADGQACAIDCFNGVGAQEAFDADVNTFWASLALTPPLWLQFRWTSTTLPDLNSFCIRLRPGATGLGQAPTAVTLRSSIDGGVTWVNKNNYTFSWSTGGQNSCVGTGVINPMCFVMT